MRTLRDASGLLSRATSLDGLEAIAQALGFRASCELDADNLALLRLPPCARIPRVARGPGAMRALLVVAPAAVTLRAQLTALAAALGARTSHVLWTLLLTSHDGSEAVIATWAPGQRPIRLVALSVRTSAVVASDAETLASLTACSTGEDLDVHTRWCELLGREGLCRRFYRTLEQRVAALGASLSAVPRDDRSELALLLVSRLLFLSFLQAKGWLDGDHAFLARHFDSCMERGGRFHRRVLQPLFFGTLNTPLRGRAPAARAFGSVPFLNGGLFARTALERRHSAALFHDDVIGALFGELLDAYRFTAREQPSDVSEAAVDPEMLGRAFEQLMSARERRVTGAFYTPQSLVAHVADGALTHALVARGCCRADAEAALAGSILKGASAERLRTAMRSMTVLDPACGSGAFLVYVLERIAALHRSAGDTREIATIRRAVLSSAIHGVDVNPTAVWLCELRLWLSVVIESGEQRMSRVPPLPNLDCNIRVGDALSGDAFSEAPTLLGPSTSMARLRERYARAAGVRKRPLLKALLREERVRAVADLDRRLERITGERRDALLARRSPDLFGAREHSRRGATAADRELRTQAAALRRERRRIADDGALAFSFPSHFGHVHSSGGFSLVIGNPPWVRSSNIAEASRASLRARFAVLREPAWSPLGDTDTPTRAFGTQVDLAALFVERSLALVAPEAVVALLLPAKLWRSLAGGSVRRMLSAHRMLALEDWTDAPALFDAAVYPSVIMAQRALAAGTASIAVMAPVAQRWSSLLHDLQLDHDDAASPWLLAPPEVRAAHDLITRSGQPLGHSGIGRVTLGVKCGLNEAFLQETTRSAVTDSTEGLPLRPLIRGSSIHAWRTPASAEQILWTHDDDGVPLRPLPSAIARRLAPFRHALASRADSRRGPWWSLYRTEGARSSTARVVWGDFGRVPRATFLPAGDDSVPLNSCYVLPCADPIDALAMTTLLNSPVAAAWLNLVAEPARGGWHRYLAWTVSLLPLPRDWSASRMRLAVVAERALLGDIPNGDELSSAVCDAYGVSVEEVAPLLRWQHAASATGRST